MNHPHFLAWRLAACCAVVLSGAFATPAYGEQSDVSVVKVTEDWELYIGEPDPNSNGPQVACTISPTTHLDGVYAVLEMNFQSQPQFVGGGLQLQIWEGETPKASRKLPESKVMSTADEVIHWTQSITLSGGVLTFDVVNGTSTTWDNFGGRLKYSVDSSLENLNGYSPDVSIANSGVAFAGNRVKLLVLRSVRYKLSDGQVVEDNTARVAHPVE